MPSLSRRRHAPKGPIKVKNNPMASTDPMGDLRPQGGRRCTAHSKQTGDRCKQPCVPGARVCHYHGGAAPHVKQAAQERLQIFQAPALDGLVELIEQTQFPSVRYAAIRDVLDRTLGKPVEAMAVDHSGEVAFRWKTDDEK